MEEDDTIEGYNEFPEVIMAIAYIPGIIYIFIIGDKSGLLVGLKDGRVNMIELSLNSDTSINTSIR